MNVFGYEDYTCVRKNACILNNSVVDKWNLWEYNYTYTLMPINDSDAVRDKYNNHIVKYDLVTENKDKLANAKTIYVHPSCTVSRSLLYQKYKKCNNPYLADVVVMPPIPKIWVENLLVFVNEIDKRVYVFEKNYKGLDSALQKGAICKNIMHCDIGNIERLEAEGSPIRSIADSVLEYRGLMCLLEKKDLFVLDILTNSLPKDKFVFEDTIMRTLSNEENQITYDNMCSIYDMLCSSDNDTVGAAVKALATMNYMDYPCSVKYVLMHSGSRYCYNKASDSTAAKYMFRKMLGGTARRGVYINEERISQRDYNLLMRLVRYIRKNMAEDRIPDYMKQFNFMYMDGNMDVHPRISGEV